ncbi:MAG: hypothetical protein VB070_14195 [Clostridiaceae bacterium]|nr:hypothetical protein [Clostridiaceae bacterium]
MIKKNKKNRDIRIEVVTTDIADLAMMGFGSIENCRSVGDALRDCYPYVDLCVIHTAHDLEALAARRPDLVVAGIKYLIFTDGPVTKCEPEKIWLSEFLDNQGIRYTGSNRPAIELDFNKKMAKEKMQAGHIGTADFFIAEPGQYADGAALPVPFPLFIKPLYESDSKGVDADSIVTDFAGYQRKVDRLDAAFHQPAMVEAYLSGREYTVAILDSDTPEQPTVMPVELVADSFRRDAYIGYETKKTNQERLLPVDQDPSYAGIVDLARTAFQVLGARDFGRIDIKMDSQGRPHFLEANLLPGMNRRHSYFPIACAMNKNWTYEQVVHQMVDLALLH